MFFFLYGHWALGRVGKASSSSLSGMAGSGWIGVRVVVDSHEVLVDMGGVWVGVCERWRFRMY